MNALVRTIIVAAVIPLVISLAAIIAILIALPELPDPVATHWNIAGEVDGTGPVWFAFIAVGLMPLGCSAFVLFLARPLAGEGITTMMRLMAATAPFLSAVLSITIGGSIAVQRGIASASDARPSAGSSPRASASASRSRSCRGSSCRRASRARVPSTPSPRTAEPSWSRCPPPARGPRCWPPSPGGIRPRSVLGGAAAPPRPRPPASRSTAPPARRPGATTRSRSTAR